jgi:hypothetical protein
VPWDEGIGRKGLHGIPNVSRSESASTTKLARFGRELGTLSNLDIRPIWRYAL